MPIYFPSYHSDEILNLPPKDLVKVIYPEDHWYRENLDPICHQRPLRLTRGIHLMKEWWNSQDLSIHYPISKDVHYFLNGYQNVEEYIRQLHHVLAPHQKIEELILVLGMGATQVLHAAFYALSMYHSRHSSPVSDKEVLVAPLYATHQTPGYVELKTLIEINHQSRIHWIDFENYHEVDSESLIECLTSPNNPNGLILRPVTKAKYHIYDRVNHWKLFMHGSFEDYQRETLENDGISVFSLSKFLSFSSSRVGYAFVKDPEIAHYMLFYIITASHGYAIEGQIRCLAALKYLIDKNLLATYTQWTQDKLKLRWHELIQTLPATSLELQNSQGPSAWIRCPSNSEEYLAQKYHVEATYGPEYGANPAYARINMLCKSNEFDEFLWRLKNQ
jgi:histidinol-phosphate/aromatic aminotransferase/cobyric acid decarboxylase-like protein